MGWMPGKYGKLPKTRSNGLPINSDKPLARSANLVIEELQDELLVYDLDRHRAHCLSASAAEVWRRCDGQTHIEGLGAGLGLDADTIDRALDELVACELLDTASEVPTFSTSDSNGSTRRQMMARVAKTGAAVAAVPLIVSLAAPLPVQAATLGFCLALGEDVGNCGNACCQKGTGCCCCHKVDDPDTRSCVPTELCGRAFYQPFPTGLEDDTGNCSCTGN